MADMGPSANPAHVLATFRSLTLAQGGGAQGAQALCPLPMVIAPADSPTDDIAQATHALLPPENAHIPLDLPLPLWSSKAGLGQVTLRSLLVLWAMRSSAFGEYMMNTAMRGGPKAASVTAPERQETLAWLRGEKDGCKLIEQWVAHMGTQAPTSAFSATTLRSSDIEYTQRSRLTYLTAPNAKDFSYLVKITHDPLVRGKAAPKPSHANGSSSSSAPASKHRSSSRSSTGAGSSLSSAATSAKSDPIILVPPGLNSLLTMYNVKSLLEDAKFTPTDQARLAFDKKPTLLEIHRKAADPGSSSSSSSSSTLVSGTSSGGGSGGPWKVLVMDSPDRLQTAADWDRVIAVFAGGMAWQFDGWRWSNAVDLFGKVRGYHLRMHDEQVPPSVQGWNVKHLVMHRTKRHLDLPVVLEFWTDLERWVRGHKPHLLP
ncbi:RNA pol II accessory factor, Cdc73 family-domain-containing protein [Catenaria anguillulae PL171]|uniref:RNA pol II accessory factor, Cdc73 family-domain-containing protein n=1 Tax=Catenaria anguillulae PL171 TaxID=765915 RepID=A0A1Y2HEJ6_9FUNG|nr:RNA pol II accessory factor, Cdc73 family-domain-containing protein [Catenaria anguillulae PL171]